MPRLDHEALHHAYCIALCLPQGYTSKELNITCIHLYIDTHGFNQTNWDEVYELKIALIDAWPCSSWLKFILEASASTHLQWNSGSNRGIYDRRHRRRSWCSVQPPNTTKVILKS